MGQLMRWRVLLTALLCLLLPLPLAGMFLMVMRVPDPSGHHGASLIQMLSPDERRALLTYERSCDSDADCEPPLGCFVVEHSGVHLCTDSMCMTDRDCPEGFACVPLKTLSEKALVRKCSLVGARKEGEKCMTLATTPRLACERGLLCQERCGRPCRMDDSSSCPEGFFCADGYEGPPSCLPTCEGRPCPEGQECLPRNGKASLCTRLQGEDCKQNPCPKGYLCRSLETPQRPWEVRTECRQLCDKNAPCPEGFACITYTCRRTCDPQTPSACGPGLTCERGHPADPWTCVSG